MLSMLACSIVLLTNTSAFFIARLRYRSNGAVVLRIVPPIGPPTTAPATALSRASQPDNSLRVPIVSPKYSIPSCTNSVPASVTTAAPTALAAPVAVVNPPGVSTTLAARRSISDTRVAVTTESTRSPVVTSVRTSLAARFSAMSWVREAMYAGNTAMVAAMSGRDWTPCSIM